MWRLARLGLAGLSGSVVVACGAGETQAPQLSGGIFPAFSLPDLAGGVHSSSGFGGKPVLINFWATWCPPCRSEMPALQVLADRLATRGMQLLAVSVDDDLNLVREFVRQEAIRFTVLIDRERDLAERVLHLANYPTSFLVGADGVIREVMVGVRPWADEQFAEALARSADLV